MSLVYDEKWSYEREFSLAEAWAGKDISYQEVFFWIFLSNINESEQMCMSSLLLLHRFIFCIF